MSVAPTPIRRIPFSECQTGEWPITGAVIFGAQRGTARYNRPQDDFSYGAELQGLVPALDLRF